MGNNGNSDRIILGGPKITADVDCSCEFKGCLFRGRKAMTNLDRDITLLKKGHLVKAMVFPIVMYGCESWTIKKAENQIIDAFELVLEKTLESLLESKEIKPNQILKEINHENSLEGLMLKL